MLSRRKAGSERNFLGLRQIVIHAGDKLSVVMVQIGIRDPARLARTALGNAASIAGPMIATEAKWLAMRSGAIQLRGSP